MSRLLITFFEQFMMEGAVEVTTAAGQRHIVGKPSGFLPAIRFTDGAAELRLLSNPALALGELFTEGRLVVTRGSIYDVVALAMRNLVLQPPTRLLRLRERLRMALRRVQQRNSEENSKRNVAHHYNFDCRLYELFSIQIASTPAPISSIRGRTLTRPSLQRSGIWRQSFWWSPDIAC